MTNIAAPRVGTSRRETALPAALTAFIAFALLLVGPAPGDAPAHLYRTFLVGHGVLLWDNLWYAGQYPLASYSLLYYAPAALFGNLPLVIAAAVASTVLFAAIAHDEWGSATRLPTRCFAILAAAPIFTGLYSYSVGFATLLAAIRCLQKRKTLAALLFSVLTLGFSPLAFVFLCLILFAAALTKRRITVQALVVTISISLFAAVEALTLWLFPSGGTYPFNTLDLAAVLCVCLLGALLAHRGDTRFIAIFFVVWGACSVVSYMVPSAVGDNATRLRGFVFPMMLIAATQARFKPRLLAVVALGSALLYNLVPYLTLIPYRLDNRPASKAFWGTEIRFLAAHDGPNYRVEVVPTASHWESYWIPRAGLALARGWYRQLDRVTNPVLYDSRLTAVEYQRWLHTMDVKYILLPKTPLDPVGAAAEARLLRDGVAGTRRVFANADGTIYRVTSPSRILMGRAPARLSVFGHTQIRGTVAARGTYTLGVRFNPYWIIRPRGTCISRTANGMTQVTFPRAGRFTFTVPASIDSVIDAIAQDGSSRCPPSRRVRKTR